MRIWILEEKCDGCKRCQRACPYDGIEVVDGTARVTERCTACGACVAVCKNDAIGSDIVPRQVPDFSDHRGIWVFAEQTGGQLAKVSLELLGKAQELAMELDQPVAAVLLGHRVSDLTSILAGYGAQQIFLADDPALEHFRTIAYCDVLASLAKKNKPAILLMGATSLGRDLAPRLSRRLGTGLTADCTELAIDPEEKILFQTRPAFGGNVMATIAGRYTRPQMATVRPGVMEKKRCPVETEIITMDLAAGGENGTDIDLGPGRIRTRVVETIPEIKAGRDITDARVIVAGGRGIEDQAGWSMIKQLAGLLDGEVACTRLIVEQGILPLSAQVGQTGKTVRPEIYIAFGISGAIQHRAGMSGSRYIIAVNKDPKAPIFDVANWGIVGDAAQILPQMIEHLSQGRGLI